MTMVNGIGAYFGSILSGYVVDMCTHDGLKDWQTIWLIFATYALVLGVVFYYSFNFSGVEVSMIFSTKGLAALITPFIIGIIADKFLQGRCLVLKN